MGYVPPRPSGIIVLPKDATFQQLSQIVVPPDFGLQTTWGPERPHRPAGGYEKYRYDLYGPARRDWFPLLNAGLLVSGIALLLTIAVFLLNIV